MIRLDTKSTKPRSVNHDFDNTLIIDDEIKFGFLCMVFMGHKGQKCYNYDAHLIEGDDHTFNVD